MAHNDGMNTRHTPAESVSTRPAREESDRKAIERAENEGLAEPPKQEDAPARALQHGIAAQAAGS